MSGHATEAETVAGIVESMPRTVALPDGGQVAVLSQGQTLVSLREFDDERLDLPRRRTGTAKLLDVDSFVAHARRFASAAGSVIYADDAKQVLTSVLNYHPGAEPDAQTATDWCDHRGVLALTTSRELTRWSTAGEMDQEGLAALLDERGGDLVAPSEVPTLAGPLSERYAVRVGTPQEIRTIARGFALHVDEQVTASARPDGTIAVTFVSDAKGPDGRPLDVPGLFVIAVPAHERATVRTPFGVRLRFRRVPSGSAQRVSWRVEVVDLVDTLRKAFQATCEAVREASGLPLLYGSPEA